MLWASVMLPRLLRDSQIPGSVKMTEASVEAEEEPEKPVERQTSGDSTDTLWEEAQGAEEDDQEETSPGTKEETLFRKLNHFVSKKFGPKGTELRPSIRKEEMEKHKTSEDFWVVIDGMVFDLGPFLRGEAKHSGGRKILMRQLELSGTEAGERFVRWHNPAGNAIRQAPDFFVGDLEGWVRPRKPLFSRLACCRRRSDD